MAQTEPTLPDCRYGHYGAPPSPGADDAKDAKMEEQDGGGWSDVEGDDGAASPLQRGAGAQRDACRHVIGPLGSGAYSAGHVKHYICSLYACASC